MNRLIMICLMLIFSMHHLAFADQYDNDRHQMKLILNNIIKGVNEKNVEVITPYLLPDVVVTFYDGRVAVGQAAVADYFTKMLTAKSPILTGVVIDGSEDKPATILNGNVAIAWGWIDNSLQFVNGSKLDVNGRWSTTMIKESDKWKIASIHFSTNIFDNALLNQAKNSLMWVGIITLIIGLIVGWFIGKKRRARV